MHQTRATVGRQSPLRSARVVNRVIESSNIVRRMRRDGQSAYADPTSQTITKVRNDCGSVRREGEILRLSDSLLTAVNPSHIWVAGDSPTVAGPYGVLLEPLPTSDIGDKQIAGICKAFVNVVDEDHEYAIVKDGEYTLQSCEVGYVQIAWKPSGTGEKECIVIVNQKPPRLRYKAVVTETGGIDPDASGEVEIYLNGSASGILKTAWLNWLHGNQPVAEGTRVIIEWFEDEDDYNGQWVIVSIDCTSEES